MKLTDYQQLATKTAVYPGRGRNYLYPVLGLGGEVGELQNKVKKILRDDGGKVTQARREEIAYELGDILWYVALVADEFRFDLADIAHLNLNKLAVRQEKDRLHGSGDKR
jgi:NTP pyrophosphatase (non-canonical NTP hydrolase)